MSSESKMNEHRFSSFVSGTSEVYDWCNYAILCCVNYMKHHEPDSHPLRNFETSKNGKSVNHVQCSDEKLLTSISINQQCNDENRSRC